MSFGIRGKLIAIFLVIKVIPLVLLCGVAWEALKAFGDLAIEQSQQLSKDMRKTVNDAGELAVADSVQALDEKAREAIERLSTDTARNVAQFLYARDNEIRFAANLQADKKLYEKFLESHERRLSGHVPWVMNEAGDNWVPAQRSRADRRLRLAQVEANKEGFHYRPVDMNVMTQMRPLYVEMTFVDLHGQEKLKVTTDEMMVQTLKDISKKENTFLKAETYFEDLQKLQAGEIYVSHVIGAYVRTALPGPYTKVRAKEAGIEFAPQDSAYAGKENPVGKRFRGIIRWATPVVRDGKKVGYVTLALDHRHLMEFSDHITPTEERYSAISDASSGNYAFMWDNEGRNISHPRDYFIVGYDPETGNPDVPWLTQSMYEDWQASGKTFAEFAKTAPYFHNPGQNRASQIMSKQGHLALDCRFLNFAPQCAGWWNLTADGGSGSFKIFWSGLWKLTTAATIPYYTGQYGHNLRGFGFVTIGANVDEFHRAATQTRVELDKLIEEQETKAKIQEASLLDTLSRSIRISLSELSLYTFIMIIIVIFVAIWMANILSGRITHLIATLRKIQQGDLSERANVGSKDEMGELEASVNMMTQSLENLIEENKKAVEKAEKYNQAKTDFLASMSHELRTPLNAVIGFSDAIRHEIFGPITPHNYREYIEDIHHSGQHLLTLINDVLDVTRIGSGEMALCEDVFDVREAIEECIRMVHPIVTEKQLDVKSDLDVGGALKADQIRFKQIVLNILSNAVKFTPRTGHIEVRACQTQTDGLLISIQDSGIGMSADEMELALIPFAQVQSSLSREYEGTGLGLPLSRTLIELHGGHLELESTSGKGTKVSLYFPVERLVEEAAEG